MSLRPGRNEVEKISKVLNFFFENGDVTFIR